MPHRTENPERGATMMEYIALLVLVAGISVAVVAWGLPTLPNQVTTGVGNAICNILNLGDCETIEVAEGESGGGDTDGAGDGSGDGEPGENGDGTPTDDPGGDGNGENSEAGEDDLGVDDLAVDDLDEGMDPEVAELREAEEELAAAEEALAEAEEAGDGLLEELLDLLWEITGGADIERCFTEGDIGSCIMAAIGLIPWGKLLKVGSKIPRMWRLFDRWRDTRRTVNARRTNVNNSQTRRDQALASCGRNSFVPGTPVLMADGSYVPIELVEVGDKIWAFDPLTGEEGPHEVTSLISGDGEKTLVAVTVTDSSGSDDTIVATDRHPFWAPERVEWIDAVDLTPGTWLRTSDGAWAQVAVVETWTTSNQRVHTLTVDELHTYYVAVDQTDILVHNQNTCFTQQALDESFNHANTAQKLEHVIDAPKHNFAGLAQRSGGREQAMRRITNSIGDRADVPSSGRFEVTRVIDGETVVIRGAVVDGIPRLGTAFIPP